MLDCAELHYKDSKHSKASKKAEMLEMKAVAAADCVSLSLIASNTRMRRMYSIIHTLFPTDVDKPIC